MDPAGDLRNHYRLGLAPASTSHMAFQEERDAYIARMRDFLHRVEAA